jgi:hypothetical protein
MPDRREHLVHGRGLRDEGGDAGVQRLEQQVILVARGQHDDAELGMAVPQLPGQLHAVTVGQGCVHGHHVRLHRRDQPGRPGG